MSLALLRRKIVRKRSPAVSHLKIRFPQTLLFIPFIGLYSLILVSIFDMFPSGVKRLLQSVPSPNSLKIVGPSFWNVQLLGTGCNKQTAPNTDICASGGATHRFSQIAEISTLYKSIVRNDIFPYFSKVVRFVQVLQERQNFSLLAVADNTCIIHHFLIKLG